MARTAVIAGTATAVSGGIAARQQARAQAASEPAIQEPAFQEPVQQQADPPADDTMDHLAKLGQMHDAGLLSDAEFAAAKAKLLGI